MTCLVMWALIFLTTWFAWKHFKGLKRGNS